MISDLNIDIGAPECPYENLTQIKPGKNDLGVMQLNIRGLLNKQDPLKTLLNNTDTDVILLCETSHKD